jgi:hypothetical protein
MACEKPPDPSRDPVLEYILIGTPEVMHFIMGTGRYRNPVASYKNLSESYSLPHGKI